MRHHYTTPVKMVKQSRIVVTIIGICVILFTIFNYFWSDEIDGVVASTEKIKNSKDRYYTISYQIDGKNEQSKVRCSIFSADRGDKVKIRHSRLYEDTIYTIDDLVNPIIICVIILGIMLPIMFFMEKTGSKRQQ